MAKRRRRRSELSLPFRLPAKWETRIAYLTASGAFRRWVLIVIGGVFGLAVAWVLATGLIARSEVSKLESQLRNVRQLVSEGRITDASNQAVGIPGLARRAHLLTSGPAWWTFAHVPYLGQPLEVMRGATSAGQEVGVNGIETVLRVATSLDPTNLRAHGNTIKIAPLTAAAPSLMTAAAALDHATSTVDKLPRHTWFSPINSARASFDAQLHAVVGYVDAAANAARVLPAMLGSSGTKRYFIGLQNEAEMRGTGGLPGAFAIATASNGTIKFSDFFSDAVLLPAADKQMIPTGLNFGTGYDQAYGSSSPTSFIVNSNLSPNFPYAAQIWARMWEKLSGQHIDGAIGMDPTTLAYFLAATGPVTLPSGMQVRADNIVSLTERDEYAMFNDNNLRKEFLVSILKAVSDKLISGTGNAATIANTIVGLATQQRLQIWSADPAAEKVLAATSYGGVIPPATTPLAGMALNNIAGGKLDYYLSRSIDYRRVGCGSTRDVFVTITLTNDAPPFGLPTYVTTRGDSDAHARGVKIGDNRTQLDYYASAGAQLLSATLNTNPTTISVEHDLGHPIFRADVELPRGTTQTLTLHLQEPAGQGAPVLWRQPGVNDLAVKYFNQSC